MICTLSLSFNGSSVVLDYRGGAATARYSVHYVVVDVYTDVILSKTPFNILVGDYTIIPISCSRFHNRDRPQQLRPKLSRPTFESESDKLFNDAC